jgi:putative transposase
VTKEHRKSIDEPGHAHELTFSCYRSFPFLNSDRSCQWLAEAIDAARTKASFLLWAYVFMPDHAHILILPTDEAHPISSILKAIKAPVGRRAIEHLEVHAPQWLPRITRTRGQDTERLFWQSGGGYDRNVITPKTLMKMIDYIHANPVRRQLVERPHDWKWSSAAWYDDRSAIPLSIDPIPADWLD